MPRLIQSATLHPAAVAKAAQRPVAKPLPAVWAAALVIAHGDVSVLHVESSTVVWVGIPPAPKRAPRKRGQRK